MSGVSGELKKALTFLLAAAGTVFTTVMAHQTALAKSADSVALRSLKFASGNMIPVIGGALGEAADGYLAGVSLIRSASGTLAAAAVISYVLPALLKIAVLRAGFRLSPPERRSWGAEKRLRSSGRPERSSESPSH